MIPLFKAYSGRNIIKILPLGSDKFYTEVYSHLLPPGLEVINGRKYIDCLGTPECPICKRGFTKIKSFAMLVMNYKGELRAWIVRKSVWDFLTHEIDKGHILLGEYFNFDYTYPYTIGPVRSQKDYKPPDVLPDLKSVRQPPTIEEVKSLLSQYDIPGLNIPGPNTNHHLVSTNDTNLGLVKIKKVFTPTTGTYKLRILPDREDRDNWFVDKGDNFLVNAYNYADKKVMVLHLDKSLKDIITPDHMDMNSGYDLLITAVDGKVISAKFSSTKSSIGSVDVINTVLNSYHNLKMFWEPVEYYSSL